MHDTGPVRLLWNLYSKPSGTFDQSCAIEEEKSFYEAKWGPWTVLCRTISPDSDRGAIFPDGSIHGDRNLCVCSVAPKIIIDPISKPEPRPRRHAAGSAS